MSEGVTGFTQGKEKGYTLTELSTRHTLLTTAGTPMNAQAVARGLAAVNTLCQTPTLGNGAVSFRNWTAEQFRQYQEDAQQAVLNKAHV